MRMTGYRDEQSLLFTALYLLAPRYPYFQRLLEVADKRRKIDPQPSQGTGGLHLVRSPGLGSGNKSGGLNGNLGRSGGNLERSEQIEAKHRQVGQIVLGYRLPPEMGMDQPQPAQQPLPEGIVAKFGDENLPLVPDNNVLNLAEPVHQDTDLAPDLLGKIGHQPRHFGTYEVGDRNAAAVQSLQPFDLACFQPAEITVQLFDVTLRVRRKAWSRGTGFSSRLAPGA